MDIISVQKRLGDLGLLDPPADGVWGGVSSWALGVVMGGPVMDEAVTSPAVETALAVATPLPLNPGDDLPGTMIKAALARGAWFCRHSKAFNIVYAEGTDLDGEGNGDPPNTFSAMRSLITIGSDGIPRFAPVPGGGIAKWIATTEPSRYWTENPMSPGGAARLITGQQKAWTMGEYHGEPALRQTGELAIQRDPNKTYKRYGPIQRGTSYGIHHHADYTYPKNNQGRSSAGCCVGWQLIGHRQFCAILNADVRKRASQAYRFASAILLHADIEGHAPPSPAPSLPEGDAISRRCTNIWMTVFAGRSTRDGGVDPEDSAYTGERIDPDVIGFSVSDRFAQPRPWVRCFANGHVVTGPLVDVGPGLTHDPWWEDPNGQPGARNGAGLDATPAAWRELGLDPREGKVRCDFELIKPPRRMGMPSWRPPT